MLVLIINRNIYHENSFGEKTISTEGKQYFINFSASEPKYTNVQIKRNELNSDENRWDFGFFGASEYTFYTSEVIPEQVPAPYNIVWLSFSSDLVKHTRKVYTYFDLLGDVGGLGGII